jgi:outer membrane receptor for ferrienterochelin and colicins
MKKIFFISILFLFPFLLPAQNTVRFSVLDSASHEQLAGVLIKLKSTTTGAATGADGNALLPDVPAGTQVFEISFIGYKKKEITLVLPLTDTAAIPVFIVPEGTVLDEVIISTTRTNSRIDDLPSKIEVLGQEEMDEESTIVPGNITSILGDLSIITIQHTSQVNGNDAIRMQGLDPKYTQIMRDGFPLYDGF